MRFHVLSSGGSVAKLYKPLEVQRATREAHKKATAKGGEVESRSALRPEMPVDSLSCEVVCGVPSTIDFKCLLTRCEVWFGVPYGAVREMRHSSDLDHGERHPRPHLALKDGCV